MLMVADVEEHSWDWISVSNLFDRPTSKFVSSWLDKAIVVVFILLFSESVFSLFDEFSSLLFDIFVTELNN